MTSAVGAPAFALNPCTVVSQMQLDALLRMGLPTVPLMSFMVAGGALTISNPQLLSITCPDGRIDFSANARFDGPQISASGTLRAISPVEVRLTPTGQALLGLTNLNVVTLDLPNAPVALSDRIRMGLAGTMVSIDVSSVVGGLVGGI